MAKTAQTNRVRLALTEKQYLHASRLNDVHSFIRLLIDADIEIPLNLSSHRLSDNKKYTHFFSVYLTDIQKEHLSNAGYISKCNYIELLIDLDISKSSIN